MIDQVGSWHRLLGVPPDASFSEIKRAYRSKIKKYHPDLNPGAGTNHLVYELVTAYEGLVRYHEQLHDTAIFSPAIEHEEFDYRTFLVKLNTLESKARLIFFDLLHNREDAAIELYESLGKDSTQVMSCLDREDYMDCAFMLAEELLFRSRMTSVLDLLYDISRLELEKPYFHFFFDDIKELIRQTIQTLATVSLMSVNTISIERFLQLEMGPKEHAWYFGKLSEIAFKRNQVERALLYLEECRRMDPRMKGMKDLQNQIYKFMERTK